MRKETYLAVFEPDGSGGYGVFFPDLPGCVSAGSDLEDAQTAAAEALGLHLYGLEKDGDPMPEPSKTLQIAPETAAGYLVCPITVFPELVRDDLDNRAVRTNITMRAWVKELAEQRNLNISQIANAAVMEVLGVQSRQGRPS